MAHEASTTAGAGEPSGIRASARRVVAHARALARLEKELARTELERKGGLAAGGVATAIAAGILAVFALAFGLATLTALLALLVDWWLALLIVFVLLVLAVVGLAFTSRSLFRSAGPLKPVQAIEEAQRTREVLKGGGRAA
jgi:uncharacterized membrane protein YqjE